MTTCKLHLQPHRMTSPQPISSTPRHPSRTLLPPKTPGRFPSPRPFLPLDFPAQISKNLTVWSQQAIMRLPSCWVRDAQGSPSPRKSRCGCMSRGWVCGVWRDRRRGMRGRAMVGEGLREPRIVGPGEPMSWSVRLASRRRTASYAANPLLLSVCLLEGTASFGPPG
jgi:hypothetical protein